MVDHPVFFCPFCGTKLQTEDEVEAKTGSVGVRPSGSDTMPHAEW